MFYVFGALGIVWSAFWFTLIKNSPAEHPRISKQELKMLEPVLLTKSGLTKVCDNIGPRYDYIGPRYVTI